MMRQFALALTVLPVLASCTPIAKTAPVAPPAKASTAMIVADALAQADTAARADKDADLVQPLAILAALDARPLDASGQTQLADWRSRSPDTAPPLRGRTLGPGYHHGTLSAGGDLRIAQTFLSGQKASIALSTPSGTKLRIQVIDGAANPVCQHVAARPSCEWIPIYTQRHVIRLTNPSRQKTRFFLVIE